eukprot:11067883-Alexandrium_andersonii.AAC.1
MPKASQTPWRANVARAMLEEHGYTAGCSKRSRVREQRPAAGARRSEERRARFDAFLRASGGRRR